MPDGHHYKFRGEGEPHSEGENGDLTYILRTTRRAFVCLNLHCQLLLA